MTSIEAFACCEKGEDLKKWKYSARSLGQEDIEVSIDYCGICYSDIHTLDSGWGPTTYPVVVGHEITGRITAKGSKVTDLELGDLVGVGAQVFACLKCQECLGDCDTLCPDRVFTYNSKYADGQFAYGGYADRVRLSHHYAFKLPTGMDPKIAAPLLCVGATVFTPLHRAQVKQGTSVGVVGIGGLGHLAVQFAAKMGATVFAISHSINKKDEVKQLGAIEFVNINDPVSVKSAEKKLDLLIVTSNHAGQPWSTYCDLLKNQGKLVLLAVPEEPISLRASSLIMRELTMTGSLIGTRKVIKAMLEFAAQHNVKPWIEEMPMSQVNQALKRVRSGKVRYRIVLKNDFN
jgi:alcohol dehydrogenase (NADP+)